MCSVLTHSPNLTYVLWTEFSSSYSEHFDLFSYLPPHVFCKTKHESELNDKTSNSMGLVWSGGRIFVVIRTCNFYDSKFWCFSECTGCLTVFCALLLRAQMSPRDLHTFQHELGHLAEENTNIHKWEHAQQKDWIGNTENKKEDKDAWHILHRTGFLTRLQWLHPPLAASNNYRCGLNLDPVVFSSQWNMGPSQSLGRPALPG